MFLIEMKGRVYTFEAHLCTPYNFVQASLLKVYVEKVYINYRRNMYKSITFTSFLLNASKSCPKHQIRRQRNYTTISWPQECLYQTLGLPNSQTALQKLIAASLDWSHTLTS